MTRTSLVASWLRICLPMQGTWVQALVLDNSICLRATKVYAPWLLKPVGPRARAPQQKKPAQREACTPQLESSPRSPRLEKDHMQQQRPSTAETYYFLKAFKSITTISNILTYVVKHNHHIKHNQQHFSNTSKYQSRIPRLLVLPLSIPQSQPQLTEMTCMCVSLAALRSLRCPPDPRTTYLNAVDCLPGRAGSGPTAHSTSRNLQRWFSSFCMRRKIWTFSLKKVLI